MELRASTPPGSSRSRNLKETRARLAAARAGLPAPEQPELDLEKSTARGEAAAAAAAAASPGGSSSPATPATPVTPSGFRSSSPRRRREGQPRSRSLKEARAARLSAKKAPDPQPDREREGLLAEAAPPTVVSAGAWQFVDATASQSAKVSDAAILAAVNAIPTIPPHVKAEAQKLLPVLRDRLQWLARPPAAHHFLFHQGDAGNGEMYFLVGGEAEVMVDSAVVTVLTAGESFGELAIGGDAKRTAGVRAKADGIELLSLNDRAFEHALRTVQATFVGAGGAHVDAEEPIPDDEWDWCLAFGCDTGQRKLPRPDDTATLQMPCSWDEWPGEGFTLPPEFAATGTGALSLTTANWCQLQGEGTEFLREVKPNDTIVVKLTAEGAPALPGEKAVAHSFTVKQVVDDQTLEICRPVKGGVEAYDAQYVIRRSVDAWQETEWRQQADWESRTWEERCDAHCVGGAVNPVDVKLRADDPFARMMEVYMHRPWLCPIHTLKLGFMKAGLEVQERVSEQYDTLFLMVRARDELLDKTADSIRTAGEGFRRNLVYVNNQVDRDEDEEASIVTSDGLASSLQKEGETLPRKQKQMSTKKLAELSGDSTFHMHIPHKLEDRGVLQEVLQQFGQVLAVTIRKRDEDEADMTQSWALVTFLGDEAKIRVLEQKEELESQEIHVEEFDWEQAQRSTGALDKVAAAHRAVLRRLKHQKGSIMKLVKNLDHGHSSAGQVSTQPGEAAGDLPKWGHVLGMASFDSAMKQRFEDRRLNSKLFRPDRSEVADDKKRFPHPRYFHSGERQILVRTVMESVEWARYVPQTVSAEQSSLRYKTYDSVQLASKDGTPAGSKQLKGEALAVQEWRSRNTFTLCDSVAFGQPTNVGSIPVSQKPLESPLWTTLRDSATPLHGFMPSHGEMDNQSKVPCFTDTILKEWQHLPPKMGVHELQSYPFRVLECQKLDGTRRRDRIEDFPSQLHIHKLRKGQELFALEHADDTYHLHYLKPGQTFEDFEEDFREAEQRWHGAHSKGAADLCRPDSIREQATFLIDAFPLHCSYEREFLQNAWCDWRNIFTRDCLNMPLNLIEGYFGSEAGFYFAYIQCYTQMLAYPAFLGFVLQMIVWWPPTVFPGSVTKLGGWVAAYCLFVSLWSSMFVVKWNRMQSELQHRWGLNGTTGDESLRKEWLSKMVPAELYDSGERLTLTEKIRRKWTYSDYAHVKASQTGADVDSARYSSKGMHAARLICSVIVLIVCGAIVVLFSLTALVMRARGANTINGAASVWTAVEFQGVSVEFWTVYEEQCERLIPTPCDEKTWLDNKGYCGECKVLVDNFDTRWGGLCDNYCEHQGLQCLGVWDEVDDTCEVKPEFMDNSLSCSVPYTSSSDAICECVPPDSDIVVHASTCDPPTDFQPETAVYGLAVSNSSDGEVYAWRHSEMAVVRSPALCDARGDPDAAGCTVELLSTVNLLTDSSILQSVPAAALVVPKMLNIDAPHISLPRRVPVYEPTCSELSTWVNASQAQAQEEKSESGLRVGLLRQTSGDAQHSIAVRKAEWSIANVDCVTNMFLFRSDTAADSTTAAEECSIAMGGASVDNTTPFASDTAIYFREPEPNFGAMLVWASTVLSVTFIGVFGLVWKTVARWMNE
jgi:hypothetical protein